MSVTLFDKIERTDAAPARYDENRYRFLNRVDQPYWHRIREELERWYEDFPDDQRNFDLCKRFRRPEPNQHFGAWWELYLHHLFSRLGFAIEVDPRVPGGTPDFRMTRDSKSFLVEATTSFSGIVDEDRRPTREAAILAAIDQATNPNFTVRVAIEQVGPDQPKVREITGPLEQWLSDLDPDDVSGRSIFEAPQKPLEVRGWKLLFTALAISPERRGRPDHRLLGIGPGMTGYVNDREQLVSALVGKRKKYQPDEALVVAVLLMANGTVDHEDIESALLGPVVYPVLPESGLGQPFRQPDGLWIRGNRPIATRISAVLTGNNLVPENVARTWPRLWPNPWAARPLTTELPLPRGVANQQGGMDYEGIVGAPNSILALADDWPGPEQAFSNPWTTNQ